MLVAILIMLTLADIMLACIMFMVAAIVGKISKDK